MKRIVIALVLVVLAGQARAGLVTYIGEDLQPTANPTVRTNSDAAAASFMTAAATIGPVATITFESAPLGAFGSLAAAPGVTITGSDFSGSPQTIRNTTNFPSYPSVDGSNTTLGGSHFVEVQGGTLTFTFTQPTQFFGAYLTGVQTNFFPDSVVFSDGTIQLISLAGVGTSNNVGETAFIGFTDAGKFITSIIIIAGSPTFGQDFIGVDDVSFQTAGPVPVPEPATIGMAGTAVIISLGAWYRKRRRTA